MKPRTGFLSSIRRTRLGLERLEERETPAGVVTLSYLNNVITFTGDGNAAGNEVRVTALSTTRFQIDGLNGTTFFIAGAGNVGNSIDTGKLPGGAPPFAFPDNGTTALKVNFTGGPDRFEYDGTGINPTPPPANLLPPVGFGDVTLNMGAGNDTVVLRQFVAKNVIINSTAPTGAATDNDTFTILAGGVYDFDGNLTPETYQGGIRGNLTINGQTGTDNVVIAARVGVNIVGTFKDANDSFVIRGESRIGGFVTVTETPTTTLGINTFSIAENTQIAKYVTLTNPNNAISATVTNSTIGGNLTLTSGSGLLGSTFDITNALIGGIVRVTGGTLQDLVNVQNVGVGKDLVLSMGNGGNGTGDTINNLTIAGSVIVNYGTGNDTISVTNSTIAGNLSVIGGEGQDRFTGTNLDIGKALTLNMGNGGNGAGDLLNNVDVAAAVTINYGTANGNDILNIQNSRFSSSATINAGAGLDRLTIGATQVGLNFAYTGGAGGSGSGLNADNINDLTVGGTFTVTYGVGVDELQVTALASGGIATFVGGGGNDTFNVSNSSFFAGLTLTGGADIDTISLDTVNVMGTTAITTSGGDDIVNITTTGRYKGKVTINTGGAGPADFDQITIEATANNEITFLGGVSITTGPSPNAPPNDFDRTAIGNTTNSRVVIMNGFSYIELIQLLDTQVGQWNNLFIL